MVMWQRSKSRPRIRVEYDKISEQLPELGHCLLLCLHQQLLPGQLTLHRLLLLHLDPQLQSMLLALQ